jgi:hypothetical protein
LLDVLWPVHNGLLRYSGFDVRTPFAVRMPGKIDQHTRARTLADYDEHLRNIDTRPRLYFHPRGHYGPDERLLPHVVPRSGFQHRTFTTTGPAVAQLEQGGHDQQLTELGVAVAARVEVRALLDEDVPDSCLPVAGSPRRTSLNRDLGSPLDSGSAVTCDWYWIWSTLK